MLSCVTLNIMLMQREIYKNCKYPYDRLTQIFRDIAEYHAPLKQKIIRGNQAPFTTKELSKGIVVKSKAKNLYVKLPSRENY